jgi:hypothetical protein
MPHRVTTIPARSSPAPGPSDVTTTSDVITGLVPVIPMANSAAPRPVGMAGTGPGHHAGGMHFLSFTGRVSAPGIHPRNVAE